MPNDNNDSGRGTRLTIANRGALLLCAITLSGLLLGFGPVLDGPLFFDDGPNLLDNAPLQLDGSQFDEWRIAVLSNDSGILHRPVAMFTFALNYFLVGDFTPRSLKTVNLLLHLVNGLLVYALASAVLRSPAVRRAHDFSGTQCHLAALGAAAAWLLHPLHVSTVLYAVQRMTILSCLFTLGGLLLYLRYRLRWVHRVATGEVLAAALWLLLLTTLGTLAKENAALLPWLVLVLEVTLFRGLWNGRERPALARIAWIALVLPALLLALVTLFAPGSLPGNFSGREFNLEERLLTQGRALWLYLQWLAVPDITQMGFFHDDIALSDSLWSPFTTGLSLLAWACVLCVALCAYRRVPLLALAFLFYLVGHAMESTVLPLELVFEHRNYLPSVGFAIVLAAGVTQLAQRADSLRFLPVMSAIVIVLGALLVARAQAWGDVNSLARFNVVNHPDSPRANFYYALTLTDEFNRVQEQGNDSEREASLAVAARTHYLRMYELDPREIAGIVMLYQFDTQYFPAAAKDNDWLGVLEALVTDRALHSSDLGALDSLVTYAGDRAVARDSERIVAILESLVQRYPHKPTLLEDLYRMHTMRGGDKTDMLPLLERAVSLDRRGTRAASHLVGYHAPDDTAAAIEALREWIRRDTLRRQIPVFKELLDP